MTVHTHTVHVSGFPGDFIDARERGIEEALKFFPFCEDHIDAALDSGALEITVRSETIFGSHCLELSAAFDDEIDLDDWDQEDEDEKDEDSSPATQAFEPPF